MNKSDINDLLGTYPENLKLGEKEAILGDLLNSRLQDAIDIADEICGGAVDSYFGIPTTKDRVAQLRDDLIAIRKRLNTMKLY